MVVLSKKTSNNIRREGLAPQDQLQYSKPLTESKRCHYLSETTTHMHMRLELLLEGKRRKTKYVGKLIKPKKSDTIKR